jgi:hypothetical protein
MDTIAPLTPARPTELRHRRVRLELAPAAAAHACGHVQAAISAWSVPVNPAVAILLTSDLVINAVTNGAGETITLGIRWSSGQFRVEVHDASVSGDSWETAEADANADRGLLLAAAMAADWGHYRTPAGRAVYYVLAPESQAMTVVPRGDDPPYPPAARPMAQTANVSDAQVPRGHDLPVVPPVGPDGKDRHRIGPAHRDETSQGGAASLPLGTARGLPPRETASGDGES